MHEWIVLTQTWASIRPSPVEVLMDQLANQGLPIRHTGAGRITCYHQKLPRVVTALHPLDVATVFADRSVFPWNHTRKAQARQGKRMLTIVETLYSLRSYHHRFGYLPCPDEHWVLRCNERMGELHAYAINYSPHHGIEIDYLLPNDVASLRVGALYADKR